MNAPPLPTHSQGTGTTPPVLKQEEDMFVFFGQLSESTALLLEDQSARTGRFHVRVLFGKRSRQYRLLLKSVGDQS